MSKADITSDGTPFILYGELYTTYSEVTNEIVRKTDKSAEPEQMSRIGDVIIPTSGETPEEIATSTCVMVPDVILAGDLNIYRNKAVDGRIVSYIINHIVNGDISRIAQGKSVVHVKADELAKIRINYPCSNEQQKIVAFLEVLAKRIEKQRQLIDTLKSYKRGALSVLFPEGKETQPQYRLGDFSDPWERRSLEEVTEEFKSGTFIAAADIKEVGTFPVYGGNGLRGYTDTYNHDGNYALIGRQGALCGNMNYSTGKAFFTEHAVAVKANRSSNTKFLYYLLDRMNLGQYSGQSAQPGLAVGKLIKLENMFPCKEEQDRIGTFLSSLDDLVQFHQRKYDAIMSVKNALLQQIFI